MSSQPPPQGRGCPVCHQRGQRCLCGMATEDLIAMIERLHAALRVRTQQRDDAHEANEKLRAEDDALRAALTVEVEGQAEAFAVVLSLEGTVDRLLAEIESLKAVRPDTDVCECCLVKLERQPVRCEDCVDHEESCEEAALVALGVEVES